ncbi:Piso0_005403 [Millerozyma farinosa CBS 7064]|uniref:Piso0_005403 protein n=1 Tax=Pichia sorbitophila (strain ATCC MYA-4447 / BCRC 22081 / CBS 7064 / NBRC 10061 / NRRL Y-12695) TaxID=559304 RepID=G8Y232_PICSO|nr:Piso0_005403 [Millerozyma farinosa CBS 7064]
MSAEGSVSGKERGCARGLSSWSHLAGVAAIFVVICAKPVPWQGHGPWQGWRLSRGPLFAVSREARLSSGGMVVYGAKRVLAYVATMVGSVASITCVEALHAPITLQSWRYARQGLYTM